MKKLAILLLISLLLTACKPKITDEFRQGMAGFLEHGSSLETQAASGISYQQLYAKSLALRGEYLLLEETWPRGLDRAPLEDFDKAFDGWDLTISLWDLKKADAGNPMEPHSNGWDTFTEYGGGHLYYGIFDSKGDPALAGMDGNKYLPYDENLKRLMNIASDYFTAGKTAVLGLLE